MIRACTLFSGSSGNCTYIESDNSAILIDAGFNAKRISEALTQVGSSLEKISAIFVTHDHSDHCSALGVVTRRYDLAVFAPEAITQSLVYNYSANPNKVYALQDNSKAEYDDFCIKSFKTSHDTAGSVGFCVNVRNKKIIVCTDTGQIPEELFLHTKNADLAVLESNYDVRMLMNGPYPAYLKKRISGSRGHLSNDECAKCVCEIIKNGTPNIILAHLSKENNTPRLAFDTVTAHVSQNGITSADAKICVAPRFVPGQIFIL